MTSLNIVNVCVLNLFLPTKRYFSIYRPPESSNLSMFFKELTISLSKGILKYENLLILGDFNIDVQNRSLGYVKRVEFCDLFNLTNLEKSEICFTKNQ